MGFQSDLICCFIVAADIVAGDIWEFVNDTDGPALLERKLMELSVDGYWQVRVHDHASGTVPIYMF